MTAPGAEPSAPAALAGEAPAGDALAGSAQAGQAPTGGGPAGGVPAARAGESVSRAWMEPFLRITDIVVRVVAAVVSILLAVVLALVAGFLLPMRAGGVPVPVISFAVVLVGNAALVWFARYGTASRLGIVGPCVAWFGTMLVLGTRTAEGDLVLPGDWRGIGLLFVGASTLAVAGFVAASPSMRRPATPSP